MNVYIHAPVARAWAFLTDYAGYARIPAIASARVVKPGNTEPAGVGAVREVTVMGSTFQEEIVGFDPPHVLAYRIIRSRPLRIEHELGRVELVPRGDGTEVIWTTTFSVPVPLVGGLLAKALRIAMQHQFNEILFWLKDNLESGELDR